MQPGRGDRLVPRMGNQEHARTEGVSFAFMNAHRSYSLLPSAHRHHFSIASVRDPHVLLAGAAVLVVVLLGGP